MCELSRAPGGRVSLRRYAFTVLVRRIEGVAVPVMDVGPAARTWRAPFAR